MVKSSLVNQVANKPVDTEGLVNSNQSWEIHINILPPVEPYGHKVLIQLITPKISNKYGWFTNEWISINDPDGSTTATSRNQGWEAQQG